MPIARALAFVRRLPGLPGRPAPLLGLLCALMAASPAAALVEIDITKGNVEPLPIAITDFAGDQVARDIAGVVEADLRNSGLFRPIEKAAFIDRISGVDGVPRFQDWKVINAQALVTGRVSQEPDGRLKAEFRLWDVFAAQQMVGQQFFTNPQNWRRVAHIIADAIYERLTGEKGYFDTRIVFVDETGPKEKRVKRLAIMDQDGDNVRILTTGSELVLTPRFSPTRQEITYMSYAGGNPRVYLLQIETGQRELVTNFPNMTFSPRFSPDGQKIIMSLQQNENSNIYVMDLRSRAMTRLTNTAAIDTAPSYSPDGNRIVFESDRGGRQQLYVMNADGSNQQRISFGDGTYDAGVVAARRPDRLHQALRRPVLHRRHAARRLGRAHPDGGLSQRGADLGAERPGADVLPRRGGWTADLFH
ncbi:MAG: hypothetical protein BroJett030_18610 [Alphaproteobacteria bacterium]|nr:MAG: hypothetical protein BroJett030_18610 [Alphaproteobacteria bacterium]